MSQWTKHANDLEWHRRNRAQKNGRYATRMAIDPEYRAKTQAQKRAWNARQKQGGIHVANLRRYGLTLDDYIDAFVAQAGRCAICQRRTRQRLFVDHDHNTGHFRALLCLKCNNGIGLLGDDPNLLRAAATYVEAHKMRYTTAPKEA